MLLALALLAAEPAPAQMAPAQSPVAGYTERADAPVVDGAVPLDWSGPAARAPGADAAVKEFNPEANLFGPSDMCVSIPGQAPPDCAKHSGDTLKISNDIFTGGQNPDSTCQSVETTRLGSNGKPQRVFATVCGDEAEAWSYRQRATPSSRSNPSRPTGRVLGPNDVISPNPVK
jgi:hypothetical protein